MTGRFLLVPHRQDVCLLGMAWDSSQIAGEISIFGKFYIFLGCCLLVIPILMGIVEILLMFLMLPQLPQLIYLDLDLVEKLKSWHWL